MASTFSGQSAQRARPELPEIAVRRVVRDRDDLAAAARCGDALRVLAFITARHVTAHILEHLGLTSDVVPIAPARAPPEDPVCELDVGA